MSKARPQSSSRSESRLEKGGEEKSIPGGIKSTGAEIFEENY